MIQKCTICGKEFNAQRSTAKYCSDECRAAIKRIKYANREKGIKEKICPICGTHFTPKTAAANQRTCCYS